MKLLKRIIEAAFLMASIMLLASDQCMVLDRRYRSVCGIPPPDRCVGRGCVRRNVFVER